MRHATDARMPNSIQLRLTLSIIALAASTSCAAWTKVDPDETGARGHRAEAAREEQRADYAQNTDQAIIHRQHADAHRAAAQTLMQYQDEECKGIPADQRDSCPLLIGVTSVDSIPEGARVVFENQVLASTALAVMKCHVAFSRAHKDEDVDACPLYIKGMTVRTGLIENSIDFVASTMPVAAEIRDRIKRILKPSLLGPMSDAR
jgi:hypothetical protein